MFYQSSIKQTICKRRIGNIEIPRNETRGFLALGKIKVGRKERSVIGERNKTK